MFRVDYDPPAAIVDIQTGYAINIPLEVQAPPMYWQSPEGSEIMKRLLMLREENGVKGVVDDITVVPRPPAVDALAYYENGGK